MPNQVDNTEERSKFPIGETNVAVQNVGEKICKIEKVTDEMGMEICRLKKENTDLRKYIHKNDRPDGLVVNGVLWMCSLIFTGVAVYWIIQVILTYRSEPLTSTYHIMKNHTFVWPRITVTPTRTCYNETALQELMKSHDITKLKINWKNRVQRFKINKLYNDSSSNMNVSQIYLKTKHGPPTAKFMHHCSHFSSVRNATNCQNAETGKWKSYSTQYNAQETYTPAPTSDITDNVVIDVDSTLCWSFLVTLQPPTERFYAAHPSTYSMIIPRYSYRQVKIVVEDFHRINTRSDPCQEDPTYSQAACFDVKIIQYKIKRAGCWFPPVTGYQTELVGTYPECDNASTYNTFMHWHNEILVHEYKYGELQQMKAQCGQPCFTRRYTGINDYTRVSTYFSRSQVRFMLDSRAMSYLSVNEEKAMPVDVFVSNIGGILGLFLGLSCITFIKGLQYISRKVAAVYRRVYNIDDDVYF